MDRYYCTVYTIDNHNQCLLYQLLHFYFPLLVIIRSSSFTLLFLPGGHLVISTSNSKCGPHKVFTVSHLQTQIIYAFQNRLLTFLKIKITLSHKTSLSLYIKFLSVIKSCLNHGYICKVFMCLIKSITFTTFKN